MLWLSKQSEFDQSVTRNLDLRDASASKNLSNPFDAAPPKGLESMLVQLQLYLRVGVSVWCYAVQPHT